MKFHLPVPVCAILTLMVLLNSAFAQPPTPVPGGDGCPDRGVRHVDAKSEGSDQGTSCSGGIPFSFNGTTYAASASLCPSNVTYTPPHKESDPSTFKYCTFWYADGTTYNVTQQNYRCFAYLPMFGCGTLGLGHCCEPDGPRVIVNVMPNFVEALCQPCSRSKNAPRDEDPVPQ